MLSLVGEEGFECQNCGAILERTEDVKGAEGIDRTGHEKNSKLMAQLDKMLKLLKQIDSVEVPPNDFETAWDHKIDVVRNQQINPTRQAVAVPSKQQQTVRGIARTDAAALEVSLTSSAEKSAAEQAEEAARKAALEKQNALPVWHTHSTVSTSAGNLTQIKTETDRVVKSEIKEEEQKPDIDALDDKVAAYYAEMARENELQAQRDVSSAEDSDEEEDEFEDVGLSTSDSATPAVAAATSVPAAPSPTAGVKRELDSESSSSAPQTAVATPSTPADEGPVAKKVKVEPDAPTVKREEESDEDDEEFEDV